MLTCQVSGPVHLSHKDNFSGQSNPASCRHRAEARGARLIANTAMVAVDEVLADSNTDGMLQLPLVSYLVSDMFADIPLNYEHFRGNEVASGTMRKICPLSHHKLK